MSNIFILRVDKQVCRFFVPHEYLWALKARLCPSQNSNAKKYVKLPIGLHPKPSKYSYREQVG